MHGRGEDCRNGCRSLHRSPAPRFQLLPTARCLPLVSYVVLPTLLTKEAVVLDQTRVESCMWLEYERTMLWIMVTSVVLPDMCNLAIRHCELLWIMFSLTGREKLGDVVRCAEKPSRRKTMMWLANWTYNWQLSMQLSIRTHIIF